MVKVGIGLVRRWRPWCGPDRRVGEELVRRDVHGSGERGFEISLLEINLRQFAAADPVAKRCAGRFRAGGRDLGEWSRTVHLRRPRCRPSHRESGDCTVCSLRRATRSAAGSRSLELTGELAQLTYARPRLLRQLYHGAVLSCWCSGLSRSPSASTCSHHATVRSSWSTSVRGLLASAIFLHLEMDGPFGGIIRVSADPLRAGLLEMSR